MLDCLASEPGLRSGDCGFLEGPIGEVCRDRCDECCEGMPLALARLLAIEDVMSLGGRRERTGELCLGTVVDPVT